MNTAPLSFTEAEFRKATRSDPDKNCVQVARRDGWVELRDDKTVFGAADDHRLVFTAEEFDAFLSDGRYLVIDRRADGMYTFRRHDGAIELVFTEAEVAAFRDGVAKHEFAAIAYTA
ncbi:uncharacterized protein DUF397 [Tamaricihabitans halophyticus]|uniref:Uncharacterized protein DUF397 n=1 Tax=Tamaricihabitans halophyticus TaxID=1262583 RepID=A0A4R2QAI1_9PSEU|nr:DUF397 domain-containing protein [Tamaricihabitans halophyticus]TCP43891.1 uncharacterized protein DUF397 [Tamaricihabitans halophyticus]